MLQFAKDCKQEVFDTRLTVVDVRRKEAVEQSQKLADSIGIPLRVRVYEE